MLWKRLAFLGCLWIVVGASCVANYDPKDIHSGSFVASSFPNGNLLLDSPTSFYIYTLPSSFATTPQAATATNSIDCALLPGAFYSIVANPSNNQLTFQISTNIPLTTLQSYKISFIATARKDIQMIHYQSPTLQDTSLLQLSPLLPLSSPLTIPFISGLTVRPTTPFSPSYAKILSSNCTAGVVRIVMETNCLETVELDVIVFDQGALWKEYKVVQGNVRLGAQNVNYGIMDAASTYILGYNGFLASRQQPRLSLSTSLNPLLDLLVTSDSLLDVSLSFLLFENFPQNYCNGCPSGSIIFDRYCVSTCPLSTVTIKTGTIQICAACDISKYMVPNELGTGCSCAVQSYHPPEADRCVPCDQTCLTCSGTTPNDCLSCLSITNMVLIKIGTSKTGKCQCPEGSSLLDGACISCPLQCLRCSNKYTCLVCQSGFILFQNRCVLSTRR